ncbi:hypothetical protein [Xanthomonas citri]|uniref:hypothetical protein n=1 Tax=Xanthomonas citri TaxID=346 RepID=UPI0013F17512|nr:hypothetical protein [Xanthomonas citri]
MTPDIDAQLKQLAEALPDMRTQHPDDFWDVFRARSEKITGAAQSQGNPPTFSGRQKWS